MMLTSERNSYESIGCHRDLMLLRYSITDQDMLVHPKMVSSIHQDISNTKIWKNDFQLAHEKFEVPPDAQDSFALGSRWRTLGIRSSFD